MFGARFGSFWGSPQLLLLFAYLHLCIANPFHKSNAPLCSSISAASSAPFKSTNGSAPLLTVEKINDNIAPGYLFFAQSGVNYITTSSGDVVWSSEYTQDASNFRKQKLNGADVLTYWTGAGGAATNTSASHGYGRVIVLDERYEQIHEICLRLEPFTTPSDTEILCQCDVHESQITDHGTILLTAYNITTTDLSAIGGPKKGWVYDSLVVEVDVVKGEVLWTWSPLAHIPITETNLDMPVNNSRDVPFDYFHTNSVQPWGSNVLINARHTSTSYLVNRAGKILWRFSGSSGGDFGAPRVAFVSSSNNSSADI